MFMDATRISTRSTTKANGKKLLVIMEKESSKATSDALIFLTTYRKRK
jgi:hypothetical protein